MVNRKDARNKIFFTFSFQCLLHGTLTSLSLSRSLEMKNRFVEAHARQSKRSNCEVESPSASVDGVTINREESFGDVSLLQPVGS